MVFSDQSRHLHLFLLENDSHPFQTLRFPSALRKTTHGFGREGEVGARYATREDDS